MKIKLMERIRGAIRGFKDPLYEKVPSSVIPTVFSKKDLQFRTLCARAWMDIPNSNDPSDEDKAIVKARAMTELVKSLEQYVLVYDDTDVDSHTYKVLVELKVVFLDKEVATDADD